MEKNATLTFEVDLPGGQGRLREMILYVCAKCLDAERFGKVKLNKILWRADFAAFKARKVPVTGRSYQKLAAGPAPMEMQLLLAEMRSEKLIDIVRVEHAGGYGEDRISPLVNPSLRYFSEDDVSYVDEAISFYWHKSASQASDLSHGVAWKSRKFLDPMPYEAAFFSNDKLRPSDLEKLTVLGSNRGWKSL